MIELYFANSSDQRVQAWLASRKPLIADSLAKEMLRQMIALSRHVAEGHLTGRPGLRNITGTLRRAVLASPRAEQTSADIKGTVSVDRSVPYARIQEYGGTVQIPEIVPKRAQALHWSSGGADVFAKRARAHPVTIPARSFMRSSLEEQKQMIIEGLTAAAAQAAKA
jgi:hypothetical protein